MSNKPLGPITVLAGLMALLISTAAVLTLHITLPGLTQVAQVASSDASNTYTWKPLKIGAGGWLVGMDIAADGTKVVRTDTYGAYLWNGSQWQQLVTSTSMPAENVAIANASGVYEIQIAPSNTSRFYMTYIGNIYRSDNRGTTWTKTGFATVTLNSNDNYRFYGAKMAIDPINPDVVYAGTPANGVWVTTNGGTSWSQVTAIPPGATGLGGMTGIAFDTAGGSAGGKTNTIYVGSWSNGVWVSTDAGTTWTKTTGGPTTVQHAVVSAGAYYAVDGTILWKYKSGTWSQVLVGDGNGLHAVAVDPTNPLHIVTLTPGGTLNQTFNGGTTWTGNFWTQQLVANDIPWLVSSGSYMSIGDIAFDPSVSGKLWASDGDGVWYTTTPLQNATHVTVTWNSQSIGIEQLVANQIISPPGGKPVVASWDRAVFYIDNPDTYRTSYYPSTFAAGWGIDWASSDPSFLVANANWNGNQRNGFSRDGGITWQAFPTQPSATMFGGTIAAASPTNFVIVGENNGNAYYTKDAGQTWTIVSAPGVPTTGTTGWGFAYYLYRRILAADRVNIGTFYMYNTITGLNRSTDGGATWTVINNTTAINPGFAAFNAELDTVPGKAGELFFSGGPQGSGPNQNHPANDAFTHSTDGGVTWSNVPNVLEVRAFGFGAPATTGGPPAIYIVGWVNKQYGIYRSTDDAQSWMKIGQWPLNSLDNIKAIEGDMNTFGTVYVGFSGSGYAYGTTSSVPVGTPAPTPDTTPPSTPSSLSATAASQTQVNLTWAASSDNIAVTGYKVFRGGTQVGTPTSNAYADTGLSAGTSYSYTVSAIDAAGNVSGISAAASVTTPAPLDTTPPVITITAPTGTLTTGTTATTLSATTNEAASCAWSATAGTAFSSMTAFTTTGNTTHATSISGLTSGTSYSRYVKCKDTAGNVSADSVISFSVAATPASPTVTLSSAPASVTAGNSSTLAWSSTNSTACSAGGGWSGTKATTGTQVLTNLVASGSYTLTCTGSGGSATQSTSVTVTAAPDTTAPSVPSNLSASVVSSSQVTLLWLASTDAVGVAGYKILRNGVQVGSQSGVSYNDNGLSASTAYQYTVEAYDAAGNVSAASQAVSVTTSSSPTVVTTSPFVPTPVFTPSGPSTVGIISNPALPIKVVLKKIRVAVDLNPGLSCDALFSLPSDVAACQDYVATQTQYNWIGVDFITPVSNPATPTTNTTPAPAVVTTQTAPSSVTTPVASAGAAVLSTTLAPGRSGISVATLQKFLIADGLLTIPPGTSLGYYGSVTEQAVAQFQAQQGIVQSGTPATTGFGSVGSRTLASINTVVNTNTSLLQKMSAITIPTAVTTQSSAPSPTVTTVHTTTTTTTASNKPVCIAPPSSTGTGVLTQTLSLGVCSNQVITLQEILNSFGYQVAATGAGSPGQENNYYGASTAAAVARFQKDFGLTQDTNGVLGPQTRAKIVQLYSTGQNPNKR